jgi:hypothetical protein
MENVENQQTDANGHGQVIVERWRIERDDWRVCWRPLDAPVGTVPYCKRDFPSVARKSK